MNTTLVIMAAGIGSRFGGGVKQLTPVGPNGEIIIDYSIHDALEAGFNKIVFIIRKDIEKDFREVIGDRIEKICDVEYVFQSLDDLPEGFEKPADRTKPWGTGQAVRCCKGVVNEPFAVINADDYYGKEAFAATVSSVLFRQTLIFPPASFSAVMRNPFGGAIYGIYAEEDIKNSDKKRSFIRLVQKLEGSQPIRMEMAFPEIFTLENII